MNVPKTTVAIAGPTTTRSMTMKQNNEPRGTGTWCQSSGDKPKGCP